MRPAAVFRPAVFLAVALLLAEPLTAQSCPNPAAGSPRPRVEVHVFQPSCDTPLLSGKRAVGRVWAIWLDDPEAGETDPEFRARITVRDGAGNQIVRGTHIFHRFPWDGRDTSRAEHTWEFVFTPERGVTESPITVEIEPLREGDSDLFPDPGVRPFAFEAGNPDRADGRRILKVNYVIPLVGDWAGGQYDEATDWVSTKGGAAEAFLVQNLPVHAVKRAGVHPLDVDVPSTTEGPCTANPAATCVSYETWGFDEQVELYLARQSVDLADESIVVVLLPAGYAGDNFRGRTVFFDRAYAVRSVLSSADFTAPDFPVVVLPVTSEAWVLAHEMAHVFRGRGHVELGNTQVREADGTVRGTARAQGIHAFRVPRTGNALSANKHSEEGNGEDVVLEPLMKEGPSRDGLRRRFVSDDVYQDLLEGVRGIGGEIWARAEPGAGAGERTAGTSGVRVAVGGPPGRSGPWVPGAHLEGRSAGLEAEARAAPSPPPTRSVGSDAPPSGDPRSAQTVEAAPHLLVRGAVGPGGEVALDRLAVVELEPLGETAGGAYRLEVRGPAGELLASRAFQPAPSLVHEPDGRWDEGSSFFVAVPWTAEARRVVVVDEAGAERASVERSGEPLELEFDDLDVDHDEGSARVEWSVAGGSGDRTVQLLYSPDGESGWVPVARDLTGGSAVVSTTGLARGSAPTFRLAATDGFGYVAGERDLDLDRFDVWSRHPSGGEPSPGDEVWVLLNTELDAGSLQSDHFVLEDGSGARVAAESGYDDVASRLWLAPLEPLTPGRTYRVRLSGDLRDRWGNRLRDDVEWTFPTEADTRAPRIVEAAPRPGDITVSVDVRPTLTFDEPLAGALDTGLRLETVGGTAVDGSTRYEPELNRLVFEPAADLERRAVYRLVVSDGVTDRAGNPVAVQTPVSFTTAGRITVGGGR